MSNHLDFCKFGRTVDSEVAKAFYHHCFRIGDQQLLLN
jgi:hypothetical protein